MIKWIKIILSVAVIVFGVLGISKVIDFSITNPIMLFSLATLLIIRGIEYKKDKDLIGFFLLIFVAVFIYIVIIYNVFIE